MNEAFEKILSFADQQIKIEENNKCDCDGHPVNHQYAAYGMSIIKKFVQKVAEQYNDGWIPCSERLPDNDNYILLSFENFSLPAVGRYEVNETGGAFYIGDEDETCLSQDLFVNAWQPLIENYRSTNGKEILEKCINNYDGISNSGNN